MRGTTDEDLTDGGRPALPLERVEARLRASQPSTISRLTAPKRAGVAAVLRYEREEPDVLLIKRVSRADDRWSGHVSFPGGMQQSEDADLLATAIRETEEEVGIDLSASARLIGRLSDQRAIAKGRALPMAITPYVFLQTRSAPIVVGDEAEAAFWFPLDRAREGGLDDTFDYQFGPLSIPMRCWRYDGQVVWGLTFRMLNDLLGVVG